MGVVLNIIAQSWFGFINANPKFVSIYEKNLLKFPVSSRKFAPSFVNSQCRIKKFINGCNMLLKHAMNDITDNN